MDGKIINDNTSVDNTKAYISALLFKLPRKWETFLLTITYTQLKDTNLMNSIIRNVALAINVERWAENRFPLFTRNHPPNE